MKGASWEVITGNGLLWALSERQAVFLQRPNEQAVESSPLYSFCTLSMHEYPEIY